VLSVSIVAVLEPFLHVGCDLPESTLKYPNPDFNDDPCRDFRSIRLLFLTRDECDYGRRLVASMVLGCAIGWERRQADRPAGIRTMGLVSLASCLFSLCSALAFRSGPQDWDASRISAAIPSGVGFLGAGLIFKDSHKAPDTDTPTPIVHGLTTAASLWMSAAVGIACGGKMYFAASFTCAILLMLLRFGPRTVHDGEEEEDEFDEEKDGIGALPSASMYGSIPNDKDGDGEANNLLAMASSMRQSRRASARLRPHLL